RPTNKKEKARRQHGEDEPDDDKTPILLPHDPTPNRGCDASRSPRGARGGEACNYQIATYLFHASYRGGREMARDPRKNEETGMSKTASKGTALITGAST